MQRNVAAELNQREIIRLCHAALDSRTLRTQLLHRLRPLIPFEFAYFTTTDPATQLGTGSVLVEQPPSWCMPVFLENEFLQQDFLKFSNMLRNHQTVGILSEATGNEPQRSLRYQNMLVPLAMEDEMRAIFVTDGACWGTLCLHREQATAGYTAAEAATLAQLAPHIADGLRKALLLNNVPSTQPPDAPGVLILSDDLNILGTTSAAEFWLAELAAMENGNGHPLPLPIRSVVARVKAIESGLVVVGATPKVRIQTRSGQWLMLSASRLNNSANSAQITVIFEIAQPAEIAPLIMQVYQLTKREGEITQCVLRGWSTAEISASLHISMNTVQDHLKAVFAKVDVGSRGELAARLFTQQFQ